MSIQLLADHVREQIQSGYCISTFSQCVNELVLNALDADATQIAIRVNFISFRIEVVDDGEGITDENLPNVGRRHYTNRRPPKSVSKKSQHKFGTSGQALASIITNSRKLKIITRSKCKDSPSQANAKTMLKVFDDQVRICETTPRPCFGTTIIVEAFLSNMPVRQKRASTAEFNDIKLFLQELYFMHPHVAFSLRDDSSKKIIFSTSAVDTPEEALSRFVENFTQEELKYYKISRSQTTVRALISIKSHSNDKSQWIYVNKRPVKSEEIRAFVNNILSNSNLGRNSKNKKHQNYLYLINISCPLSKYSIINDGEVEFQKINSILTSLNLVLTKLLEKEGLLYTKPKVEEKCYVRDTISLSKFPGAYKVSAMKRTEINNESHHSQCDLPNIIIPEKIATPGSHVSKNKSELDANTNSNDHHTSKEVNFQSQNNVSTSFDTTIFGKCYMMDRFIHSSKNSSSSEYVHVEKPDNNQHKKVEFERRSNDEWLHKDPVLNINECRNSFWDCNPPFEPTDSEESDKDINMDWPQHHRPVPSKETLVDKHIEGFRHQRSPEQFPRAKKSKNNSKLTRYTNKDEVWKQPEKLDIGDRKDRAEIPLPSTSYFPDLPPVPKNNWESIKIKNYPITSPNDFTFCVSDDNDSHYDSRPNSKSHRHVQHDRIKRTKRQQAFDETLRGVWPDQCEDADAEGGLEFLNELPDSKRNDFFRKQASEVGTSITFSRRTIYRRYRRKLRNKMNTNNARKVCAQESVGIQTSEILMPFDENCNLLINRNMPILRAIKSILHEANFSINVKRSCQRLHKNDMQNLEPIKETIVLNSTQQKDDAKIAADVIENTPQHLQPSHSSKSLLNASNKPKEDIPEQQDASLLGYPRQNFSHISFESTPPISQCVDSLSEPPVWQEQKRMTPESPTKITFNNSLKKSTEEFPEIQDTLANIAKQNFSQITFQLSPAKSNHVKSFSISPVRQEQNFCEDSFFLEDEMPSGLQKDVWSLKFNDEGGSYYLNKRTGNTRFNLPISQTMFDIATRPEHLPKGFSQNLKGPPIITDPISSGTKQDFYNAVCENAEELACIKWKQNYLQNTDAKTFFQSIYDKQFMWSSPMTLKLPSAAIMKKQTSCADTSVTFSKKMLRELEVITQYDKKFILCVWKSRQMLIIFDQHAVDERIRVEKLFKCYRNEESGKFVINTVDGFELTMREQQITDCIQYSKAFERYGLRWIVKRKDAIHIQSIPYCLYSKGLRIASHRREELAAITKRLIEELLHSIQDVLKQPRWMPSVLTNTINSEACRGAVKFGDALSLEECSKLINDLSTCNLPFLCAHGRPTCVPLLQIDNNLKGKSKINLERLKSNI